MGKFPQQLTRDDRLDSYGGSCVKPMHAQYLTSPSNDYIEVCVVDEHAWIPPSNYFATYISHELKKKHHGYDDKLVIEYSIVEGDYKDEIVRGFFTIEILTDYKYRAKGGSRWVREMRSMFPALGRKVSPSVSMLSGRVIEIQVRDSGGKGGKPLDEDMRYSVVKKMLRVVK